MLEARNELEFARAHASDVERSDLVAAAAALGDGSALDDPPLGTHQRSAIFT
jgi:hypothetical protein